MNTHVIGFDAHFLIPFQGALLLGALGLMGVVAVGCGGGSLPPEGHPPETASGTATSEAATTPKEAPTTFVRRGFNPKGKPLIAGISYGPYRENQRPGGPNPTSAQIAEDLAIIASRWSMIRVYSSRGVTEDIVRTVRDNNLPLQVLVGAWIAADAPEDNAEEVAEAIRIANSYPEQVLGVSVGNETQVYWSGHRSPRDALIDHIRTVRAAVRQPVTTADDYNFWNTPESHAVADEVDFLLLHAYAMWNQQQLADAVSWTEATVDAIAAEHPDLTIVIGETGWATELNPEVGDQAKYIKAPAGEAEQARFYAEFTTWAQGRALPYFYFEAFDEPWKGGDDPRDVEKHWGLYRVDRTPKAAMIKGEGTP